MKVKINGKLIFDTKATLVEIAEKIKNKVIEVNEHDNLINWENVYSVTIVKNE